MRTTHQYLHPFKDELITINENQRRAYCIKDWGPYERGHVTTFVEYEIDTIKTTTIMVDTLIELGVYCEDWYENIEHPISRTEFEKHFLPIPDAL